MVATFVASNPHIQSGYATKSSPENMVYDWDDKRDACHRMYVVERKSLDHVMKVFKESTQQSLSIKARPWLRNITCGQP